MDQKEISQFERLLNDAKESKHTDAVLLLSEKKPEIQNKFASIVKTIRKDDDKEQRQEIEKTVSIVAERVFNECVNALLCDKK